MIVIMIAEIFLTIIFAIIPLYLFRAMFIRLKYFVVTEYLSRLLKVAAISFLVIINQKNSEAKS